jgi:hypothetical protein
VLGAGGDYASAIAVRPRLQEVVDRVRSLPDGDDREERRYARRQDSQRAREPADRHHALDRNATSRCRRNAFAITAWNPPLVEW